MSDDLNEIKLCTFKLHALILKLMGIVKNVDLMPILTIFSPLIIFLPIVAIVL